MSGTILPSLPPLADDYVVTVCAACKFRFCLLERKRCDARKNGDPGELRFTVAELRASGSQEHHSYWRAERDDDPDMPKSIEDVKELAATMRDRKPIFPPQEEPQIFAGYLIEQLGLDEEQCRDAIRDIWPEASEAIELARLQIHADKMRASEGYHRPSEETWVLAADQDGTEVVCAGWPESIAQVSDCELKRHASDEERIEMLRSVAAGCEGQYRGRLARNQLAAEVPAAAPKAPEASC